MTISLDSLGIRGRKIKRVKDSAYHKEKMLLCKQAEQGVPLQAEQYDWLADTDEEIDEQELEAHYSYMNEQNDVESDDERVALANLIANLKLDVDENKKIQKKLKKANTILAQELKECKAILAKTSKSLGESISVRDNCLVALQNKQTEFEKYKAFNDRTIDYGKLERYLNRYHHYSSTSSFNCFRVSGVKLLMPILLIRNSILSLPRALVKRSASCELAKQADSRSSFNELLDTPIDFSNFIMNRLCVDTLTPELLAGPTYELMRGSCNSLTELEYHLEEVYKATTDQLDWVNPEGQQYLHNLPQPLPLIPDNRGRRVIPFAYFINNDLEYLRGGDFKRLRLQDIEDMLLLLVQGKLSNLTVEEQFAFNVSLRIFTRSIVIQRRVEDLQLGVESYQKRLNLTKPDTYRSDLKRREAYTAYSNPRGFIYQNKDKKNRLMRIDELHKFNDGTLNDVPNALDDRLKGIRMQYLPQTI
nr:hypothetical protein [Tanacetum cinerariifolium]